MKKTRRSVNYYNSIKVERKEWKHEQPEKCCFCLKPERYIKLEVHEIERRSAAPNNWGHRCNYLLLCRRCHSEEFDTMPHKTQLAVKLIQDPSNFDLKEWLAIRPRPSSYVTMEEVMKEVEELI